MVWTGKRVDETEGGRFCFLLLLLNSSAIFKQIDNIELDSNENICA